LEKFDIEGDLYEGYIRKWVHFFDAALADRVKEIEEKYDTPARRKPGIFKLRGLLDPTLPLMVGEEAVSNLAQLAVLLQASLEDEHLAAILETLFWGEFIECWVEAAIEDPRTPELLATMQAIRTRVPTYGNSSHVQRRLGLFALLYTLDPKLPLKLPGGGELTRPEDIEDLLRRHPELQDRVKEFLCQGNLEEWLLAAFPDRADAADFLGRCRRDYQQQPDQGCYACRWYFNPAVPFPFGPETVSLPEELAARIDRGGEDWLKGIELLSQGWIKTWLTASGRLKDTGPFDQIVNTPEEGWDRKLENVLHLLDPELPWPQIAADRVAVDLSSVGTESTKTVALRLYNAGRGYLAASFSLQGSGKGITMDRFSTEGGAATVVITAKGQGLPMGSRQQMRLIADGNGGRLDIPISFRVAAPWTMMTLRSLRTGLVCALAFGLLRLVMEWTMPSYWSARWYGWDYVWNNMLSLYIAIPWFLLLATMVGGDIYYLWRMAKITVAPQKPNRESPGGNYHVWNVAKTTAMVTGNETSSEEPGNLSETGLEDNITGNSNDLEWYAGPDQDTTWDEADAWVKTLRVEEIGWRMPTRQELKSLYQKGLGTRNMDPTLKTSGWWVWSGELSDSSSAWDFNFIMGKEQAIPRRSSTNNRVFAVRSRPSPGPQVPMVEAAFPKPAEKNATIRFSKSAEGIIYDRDTNLEWYVGPNRDTIWKEAKAWVKSLEGIGGSGWRLPTRQELESLYQKGLGTRNMDPCFATTTWWVWSGEVKDSLDAWGFSFHRGQESWNRQGYARNVRAFAVRSRS
jgi:hypothetical protein